MTNENMIEHALQPETLPTKRIADPAAPNGYVIVNASGPNDRGLTDAEVAKLSQPAKR